MKPGHGFLLLTSQLGNPQRKPLTTAQLRILTQRVRWGRRQTENEELSEKYLISLGYDPSSAKHIQSLLADTELLEHYLHIGQHRNCFPITRQDPNYPLIVRKRLGLDSPGTLWIKGNREILNSPAIALVGSRELREDNRDFACEVGYQAAMQGFALVSGNARGADIAAQKACLEAGGQVICIVADSLMEQPDKDNILFISEEDYDAEFSAMRALRRNRVIHTMGWLTLVAQSSLGKGGTWKGTVQNLNAGWNKVFCYNDGSEAVLEMERLGAILIDKSALNNFAALSEQGNNLFGIIPGMI